MADHQAATSTNLSDEKNSNLDGNTGGEISADLDSIPNQIGNAILQINGSSDGRGDDMDMSIVRQPTGSLSIADVKTLYNILLEIGTILSTDGRNVNVNTDIYNGYNNGNMEEESKEESKNVGTDANANSSADVNTNTNTSVPSGSATDLVGMEGWEKKQIDENTDANMNINANANKKHHQEEEFLKRVNVDVGQYSYSMCLSKGGLVYMVKKQNTAS
eukprot:157907_1